MKKLGFVFVLLLLIAAAFMPALITAQAPTPAGGPLTSANVLTAVGSATDTTAQDMLAAPPTNVRNYVFQAQCINVSASTQAVASIKSGSTVVAYVACPPASTANGLVTFNP